MASKAISQQGRENEQAAPLSPVWTFVVQLRVGTVVTQAELTGRVEHVMSGQATHFESVEDLLRFFTRVLTMVEEQSQKHHLKNIT